MAEVVAVVKANNVLYLAQPPNLDAVQPVPGLVWPGEQGFYSDAFKSPTTPLWALELTVDEENSQFAFSTPITPFEEAIVALFDNGIAATSGVASDVTALLATPFPLTSEPNPSTHLLRPHLPSATPPRD
jgi:hypothetical protein